MLIRAGYNIAFQCPAQTSMLLHLSVHPSRVGDLRSPDVVASDPNLAMGAYLDMFGNRVTRVDVPPGTVTFSNNFTIYDTGQPDEMPVDTPLSPIARLPNDVLVFLVPSRYCDSDNLSNFAWSMFGSIPGGYGRVQAICDFVHCKNPLQLSQREFRRAARAMRCARGSASAATSRIWRSRFAAR